MGENIINCENLSDDISETIEEDSPIALLNKPLAKGDVHKAETLLLPADSPAIVILFLSPPK